jgi:transportin-1
MEQSLLQFFSEMSLANPNLLYQQPEMRETFKEVSSTVMPFMNFETNNRQVIEKYKSMIPNFDAFLGGLPPDQQARFRKEYSV